MIKVIVIASGAWDSCIGKTSEENVDKNKCTCAWESSILNQFINEGWNIKDWKTNDYNRPIWTFILEKTISS